MSRPPYSEETREAFRRDPSDRRHGTTTGYFGLGCKCELCSAAGSASNKERKARRRMAAQLLDQR